MFSLNVQKDKGMVPPILFNYIILQAISVVN
jgi:hypothetical protein